MKRRNWTHGIRHSIHRQVMELRSLPDSNSIAWCEGARRQRDSAQDSLFRLRTELAKVKGQARNAEEMARNSRCEGLRRRLALAVIHKLQRDELAKLQAMPLYASTSKLGQTLLGLRVSWGGLSAAQAVAA